MRLIPLVYLVVLLIAATSGLIRYWRPSWLQRLRLQAIDLYQRLERRARTADKVVIFDIDEQSLAPSCQWPWPRSVIAELLDKITISTAGVVGFNVIFAELDRYSPQQLQATLPHLDPDPRAKLLTLPNTDDLLAEDHLVGT
jgi:adenylate cyclase